MVERLPVRWARRLSGAIRPADVGGRRPTLYSGQIVRAMSVKI